MPCNTRGPRGVLSTGADAFSPRSEKATATEIRYTKLKEKHSELINTHAELLRKVTLLLVPGRDSLLPSSLCPALPRVGAVILHPGASEHWVGDTP